MEEYKDIEFGPIEGKPDLPEQTPVDGQKIAADMLDWRRAMGIYNGIIALITDPSKTFAIKPNVLVEPPTKEEAQVLKEHLEKKEKMTKRIMSTIRGWCIKNSKEFPQDHYQK